MKSGLAPGKRIDLYERTVEWFGEAQGLSGKSAYTLRFDHQQRLWAATEDWAIFCRRAVSKIFPPCGIASPHDFGQSPREAMARMWAGGADGLFAFANGRWKNFTRATV